MRLNLKKLPSKLKTYWPLILILALSLFLRAYKLESRASFDADQEDAAFRASQILGGDVVLLGPQMSVGGFSIGPYFYYLWAITSFITAGSLLSGAVLSVFMGLLTILAFYFAGKLFFDYKTGLVLALISGLSFGFVTWDQVQWAPSLFYFSELLMIIGAFLATKKSYGIILVSLGFALGFSAHLGIVLVLLGILIFWFFAKPVINNTKHILISFFSIAVGILPFVVFDIFHQFANTKRLLDVFGLSTSGTPPGFERILSVVSYSALTQLTPLVAKSTAPVIFGAIVLLGFLGVIKDVKNRNALSLIIISLLLPPVMFLFYKGKFSEYYLMMIIPPFILLVGYFLSKLKGKLMPLLVLGILVFAFINVRYVLNYKKVINLKAKKDAVLLIKQMAGTEGYGISLTTNPGQYFGFKYLFHYYGINADNPPKPGQKIIYTIVVPDGAYGIYGIKSFDGVGVRWEGVR